MHTRPSAELFKLEKEMSAPVTEWLRGQGLTVKREFTIPWGICDLVGLRFDSRQVRKRLAYGQSSPVGPALRVSILSKIPDADSGSSISLRVLRDRSFAYLDQEFLESELQ